MSETIPVIDLADYFGGGDAARQAMARQVRGALTEVGFMVITGHDVPQTLIDRTFDQAKRVHSLPMERKLALRLNNHNNGYMAMNRYAVWTSDVNRNDKPDLNEAFFIKRERAPDDPLLLSGRRFVGPNVWPDEAELPGFRAATLDYVDRLDHLARRIMPAVATALDLPADWFDRAFAESQFSFRLSHYPPVPAEANQFGIAPHTDANFLTFLPQSAVPGLQVRMPSGDWQDVPAIPGSFAVNSGDTMRRWTNARFKSTPHRALPPVGVDRYAIPFFVGPHIDTIVECLPGCASAERPAQWPPITYGAWLEEWNNANYDPKAQHDVAA